jgi:hypothetical protein
MSDTVTQAMVKKKNELPSVSVDLYVEMTMRRDGKFWVNASLMANRKPVKDLLIFGIGDEPEIS